MILAGSPAVYAVKQQTGGVPTLNVNAKHHDGKKSGIRTSRHYTGSSGSYSVQPMQLAVPAVAFSSRLFRRGSSIGATPAASMHPSTNRRATAGSAPVFTYMTTDNMRKGLAASSGMMSGGATAGGLMSSGSSFASAATTGGGTTTGISTSSGPRRVGGYDDPPDEPFPDEDEDEEAPIGDAVWALMALAMAYLVWKYTPRPLDKV